MKFLTILASTLGKFCIDELYHMILIAYTFMHVSHILQQSFLKSIGLSLLPLLGEEPNQHKNFLFP